MEPEVVATSPCRIKSPMPVCCGFDSIGVPSWNSTSNLTRRRRLLYGLSYGDTKKKRKAESGLPRRSPQGEAGKAETSAFERGMDASGPLQPRFRSPLNAEGRKMGDRKMLTRACPQLSSKTFVENFCRP